MKKLLKNLLTLALVAMLVWWGFKEWDSMPEMAWSQSSDSCVKVTRRGRNVLNGCQLVAEGKLRAEKYIVK